MKLNVEEVRGLSKCHREDVVMNADLVVPSTSGRG